MFTSVNAQPAAQPPAKFNHLQDEEPAVQPPADSRHPQDEEPAKMDPARNSPTIRNSRSVGAESGVASSGRSSTDRMSIAGMLIQSPSSSSSEHRFLKIGEGWCGVVYEYTGTGAVLKREKRGITTLFNDFNTQTRIWQCFQEAQIVFGSSVLPRTTRPFFYTHANSIFGQEWWKESVSKFPKEDRGTPVNSFFTERIPSIPLENQEDLIDKFCVARARGSAKKSLENKSCIARLYLGRRKRGNNNSRFFNSKNFALDLDMAEEWGINVKECASQMAIGLAVCHWRANVDANDVEFVLGGLPAPIDFGVLHSAFPTAYSKTQQKACGESADLPERGLRAETLEKAPTAEAVKHLSHRIPKPMKLWMLDYDKCRSMPFTEEGLRQAAHAVEDNDPYFPKPLQDNARDQELWEHFKLSYLDASEMVLSKQGLVQLLVCGAPRRFLEEWEIYRHSKIKGLGVDEDWQII